MAQLEISYSLKESRHTNNDLKGSWKEEEWAKIKKENGKGLVKGQEKLSKQ